MKATIFNENGREYILLSNSIDLPYDKVEDFIWYFEDVYNTPLYTNKNDMKGQVVFHVDNTTKNRNNYIRMVKSVESLVNHKHKCLFKRLLNL